MPEALPMEEEVADALRQLSSEGIAGPNYRSQARARQAMFAAVVARRERPWLLRALRRPLHPRNLIAELALLMVAAIGAVGWSAPAGTPFHGVRFAREAIARSLSGESRLDVDLSFAEQYLAEAARNQAPQDSEAEARLFLEEARRLLPANQTDPMWQRWRADENQLAALSAPPPAPVGIHASPAPRRTPAPKPSATGSPSDEDRAGGEGRERASPPASPAPSPQASPQPSPTPHPDR
jgi:hypothetical protein